MERLPFGFYHALYDELEMYETHFQQLIRDYRRELRGETLIFAVDFAELYNYIHGAAKDAERAEITSYILTTLRERFSILPGAVGELLADLERSMPKRLKPNFGQVLYRHPAVVQFRVAFPHVAHDEEKLLRVYAEAEAELRSALGAIVDVLVNGHGYAAPQALRALLSEGKLVPIGGVKGISDQVSAVKHQMRLVQYHLGVSRPELTESNQIDAMDFGVALLLNQRAAPRGKKYITIYSQAPSLLAALRSHKDLRWDEDYLVREAKYLQFRAKLQDMFPRAKERQGHVEEFYELCRELKTRISALVDVDERFREGATAPALKLVDLYRRFDHECKRALVLEKGGPDATAMRKRAQELYDVLRSEARFAGKANESYDVLKEHLRAIHEELQSFAPTTADTRDARRYKRQLREWLGLDDTESSRA